MCTRSAPLSTKRPQSHSSYCSCARPRNGSRRTQQRSQKKKLNTCRKSTRLSVSRFVAACRLAHRPLTSTCRRPQEICGASRKSGRDCSFSGPLRCPSTLLPTRRHSQQPQPANVKAYRTSLICSSLGRQLAACSVAAAVRATDGECSAAAFSRAAAAHALLTKTAGVCVAV